MRIEGNDDKTELEDSALRPSAPPLSKHPLVDYPHNPFDHNSLLNGRYDFCHLEPRRTGLDGDGRGRGRTLAYYDDPAPVATNPAPIGYFLYDDHHCTTQPNRTFCLEEPGIVRYPSVPHQ